MAEGAVIRDRDAATSDTLNPVNTAIKKMSMTDVARDYFAKSYVKITNHYGVTSREDGTDIKEEMLLWLEAPNYRTIYETALEQRLGNTGNWLTQTHEFRCWEGGKGSILWITGIPGSGKTVVGSIIVDHLENKFRGREDVGIAFAFLRYTEVQPGLGILAGLLSQLVESRQKAYAEFHPVYSRLTKKRGSSPRAQDILPVLKRITANFSKAFIVIDGFDETDDAAKNDLLEWLPSLGANLLILSRPLEAFALKTAVRYTLRACDEDIDLYITGRILRDMRLYTILNGNPSAECRLREGIKAKSDGMFLVVKLQMDSIIANSNSVNGLFHALESMPMGVSKMYEHTLHRVNSRAAADTLVAHRVFTLLLQVLKEPMTVRSYRFPPSAHDIQHAIAVNFEGRTLDYGNLTPIPLIITACCGLVVEEELSNYSCPSQERYTTLKFVHYSAPEYLEKANIPGLRRATPVLAHVLQLVCELLNTPTSIVNDDQTVLTASAADLPQDGVGAVAKSILWSTGEDSCRVPRKGPNRLTHDRREVEGNGPQPSTVRKEQMPMSPRSGGRGTVKANGTRKSKQKRQIMPLDPALEDARPTDIVIPILGPAGAGKSTFINHLLQHIGDRRKSLEVGDALADCTLNVQPVVIDDQIEPRRDGLINLDSTYRIVMVDTPGFGDTTASDYQVLARIARWLEESLRRKMILGGVIYLHDISQDRFSGTARRNLNMFSHLCGEAALDKVVLVTSKWSRQGSRDFGKRERELREIHWTEMLPKEGPGATVMRLDPGETGKEQGASAWKVVNCILKQLDRRTSQEMLDEVLQIQNELVREGKSIPETEAAKELMGQLEHAVRVREEMLVLESQAAEDDKEAEEQVRQKTEQLREMHLVIQQNKISLLNRMTSKFRRIRRYTDKLSLFSLSGPSRPF
ncbi:hypothetical protein NMY22_g15986 [Coprinellus aureogranulatus]|nr:hypothetical protein NMY22_g15986 [Coprinellus aureogranulatus]